MACYDDAGNVYHTLAASVGGGSNNEFPMGALFMSRLRNGLSTTNTIHVLSDVRQFGGARAMAVEEFSMDETGTYVWAVTDRGPVRKSSHGIDPEAITINDLNPRDYLFLHLLGCEGPNGDTYTWDADYTEIAGNGTSGGADDSNIHVRGGYRIATLVTEDTVDITASNPTRDTIQLLVAITEIIYEPEFPISTILDDFNRADEAPLDNGNWDTAGSAGPTAGLRLLQIENQQARGQTSGGAGGQWWIDPVFEDPDVEVFARVVEVGNAFQIQCFGKGYTNNGNAGGLGARWLPEGGQNGLAVADHIEVGSVGNSGGIDNDTLRTWINVQPSFQFGIQRIAPNMNIWVDIGSGWEWACAIHANGALLQSDSEGKLGLALGNDAIADDFGGGPLWIPQIYRRPRG